MPWEFPNRNLIGGFLQLEDLLINKLALFMGNDIRVERAGLFPSFPGLRLATTASGQRECREPALYVNILAILAIPAFDMHSRCLGRYGRGANHDSGDTDKMRDVGGI